MQVLAAASGTYLASDVTTSATACSLTCALSSPTPVTFGLDPDGASLGMVFSAGDSGAPYGVKVVVLRALSGAYSEGGPQFTELCSATVTGLVLGPGEQGVITVGKDAADSADSGTLTSNCGASLPVPACEEPGTPAVYIFTVGDGEKGRGKGLRSLAL
jgi:hypothetical protein